jgi:hypothetical protein
MLKFEMVGKKLEGWSKVGVTHFTPRSARPTTFFFNMRLDLSSPQVDDKIYLGDDKS